MKKSGEHAAAPKPAGAKKPAGRKTGAGQAQKASASKAVAEPTSETTKGARAAQTNGAKPAKAKAAAAAPLAPSMEAIWNTLPTPSIVFDPEDRFVYANAAAELYFRKSATTLARHKLADFWGEGSRLVELVAQARRGVMSLSEYGVEMDWFEHEGGLVDLQAAQIYDAPGHVLLMIQPRSVAEAMDRSLSSRGSVRSLSGLAAMLAHEIKNPLSGISGAVQLLEMNLGDGEAELIKLVHEEVERIRLLLERMDMFGDEGPGARRPINIHHVLDQARRAASAGFAQHIRFKETYDPSLPAVPGDRGRLLQAISNLVKNAAEAAPSQGGEITLKTAYRPGVKIAVAGGGRERLPLEVSVIDNGPGVPDDMRPHIFEPFVTSKNSGTGLGLALVAKIVADHGGVVECVRLNDKTAFRMLLPVWTEPLAGTPFEQRAGRFESDRYNDDRHDSFDGE